MSTNQNTQKEFTMLHPKFKDWLIEDTKDWTPEQKQNFLRMAKFNPDQAVHIISDNLLGWATVFCYQTGIAIIVPNNHEDAQQLFTAYQKHFAVELAAIT